MFKQQQPKGIDSILSPINQTVSDLLARAAQCEVGAAAKSEFISNLEDEIEELNNEAVRCRRIAASIQEALR